MTLKEELEILRGEPIEVFDGDPMDIPCIETSDAEKLCKHPVVSVHMITYNHEPYIRQARVSLSPPERPKQSRTVSFSCFLHIS